MSPPETLSVPDVPSVRYTKNFINVAVCELRFPTMLELETKPPSQLQSKLRKEYPSYEVLQHLDTTRVEGLPGRYRYVFRSRKGNWSITVHSEGISLETGSYTEFDDFVVRLDKLIAISAPFIDSDFFTRVGLRYINKIPVADRDLCGWINEQLCSPLTSGPYGSIAKYVSEVRGYTKSGEYTFRHAVTPKNGEIDAVTLDFDYSKEDVERDDVLELVRTFNKQNFAFFSWCLGPKARAYLGEGKQKRVKS
jgi:uncharacterized protein (TIGR04255 family)